ncbi:hypothetical protein Tco_0136833 [Tanacetum coccineum]
MMNASSLEPPPHLFKKKSLIAMGVIMELQDRGCCWPATREAMVKEEDEANEAAREYVGHEGVGGFTDIYRNMSQADYPPIGYQGYMPPGYEYRPVPFHDDS